MNTQLQNNLDFCNLSTETLTELDLRNIVSAEKTHSNYQCASDIQAINLTPIMPTDHLVYISCGLKSDPCDKANISLIIISQYKSTLLNQK